MSTKLDFKRTECCEEHSASPMYLGSFVDPNTYMDLGKGELYAIPPEDLRATWLQPVQSIDPDTGKQHLATALAGVVESGHTFVFGIELVPCFAQIPLS